MLSINLDLNHTDWYLLQHIRMSKYHKHTRTHPVDRSHRFRQQQEYFTLLSMFYKPCGNAVSTSIKSSIGKAAKDAHIHTL
jgi:hypothetical protein